MYDFIRHAKPFGEAIIFNDSCHALWEADAYVEYSLGTRAIIKQARNESAYHIYAVWS
jgi:hypothetical protein